MTALFWLAFLMQMAVLVNVTIFDGDLDGLMMGTTTILFLMICIVHATKRMKKK